MEIRHLDDALNERVESAPDPRSGLIFNGYIGSTRLIALAQPTDWTGAGIDFGVRALAALRRGVTALEGASDLSAGDRARRAFGVANIDLLEYAQTMFGNDLDNRSGVGAAVVLVEGSVATIGLVPPAQVLLWQDGRLTWCPTRESWTGQQPGLAGAPLGWAREPHVTVVATSVNQRDELVLTTDTLAKQLAQMPPSELRSSAALCDQISRFGLINDNDATPIMAVSTRFIAPSLAGSVFGSTRQTLVGIESRVKSAWTTLRSQQ